MIRGQFSDQIEKLSSNLDSYKNFLQKTLNKNVSFVVGTDRESDLVELCQTNAELIVYFVNKMDEEIIHKNYTERTRQKYFDKSIENISVKICDALKEYQDMNSRLMRVIVCSDHGYTPIPKNFGESIKIEETNAKINHYRVAESSEKLSAYPKTYLLQPHEDYTNNYYLIARGFNYFGSKPIGGVHGGITPQELAVPIMIFTTLTPNKIEDIEIFISGSLTRGKDKNELIITLINPNDIKVIVKYFNMYLSTIHSSFPIIVDSNSEKQFKVNVDASNVKEKTIKVAIEIQYQVLSILESKKTFYELETKGAALAVTEFEDEFD